MAILDTFHEKFLNWINYASLWEYRIKNLAKERETAGTDLCRLFCLIFVKDCLGNEMRFTKHSISPSDNFYALFSKDGRCSDDSANYKLFWRYCFQRVTDDSRSNSYIFGFWQGIFYGNLKYPCPNEKHFRNDPRPHHDTATFKFDIRNFDEINQPGEMLPHDPQRHALTCSRSTLWPYSFQKDPFSPVHITVWKRWFQKIPYEDRLTKVRSWWAKTPLMCGS